LVTLSSSYVTPAQEAVGQGAVAERLPMYAVGWMDKRLKAIVCNCSTSIRAMTNSVRRRHRKIFVDGSYSTESRNIEIKWPEAIRQFFHYFVAIDLHDHYRQGILEMERTWLTKKWWIRVFTTILGVIFVNSYFAYRLLYKRLHHDSTEGMESLHEFLGHLAYELIFNDFLTEGVAIPPRNRSAATQVEVINSYDNIIELLFNLTDLYLLLKDLRLHSIRAYSKAARNANTQEEVNRNINNRFKLGCRKCAKTCSYYCIKCSNEEEDNFFGICCPSTERDCLLVHINDCYQRTR